MPIVTPSNNYLLAIDKQTDEATVSSTADYSVPVFSANLGPAFDTGRVEVTDASSIEGDFYKKPSYWTADVEFPAFAHSLGRFLQALWPTDTKTGAGDPYTHTYSGLGGTQSWIALYSEWPGAGTFEQTFGKGQATGITFSADADGGPLRIGFRAIGSTPTVASYSATVADDLTDGYFTLQASGASIKLDFDTPNVSPSGAVTNVESFNLSVDRSATPIPTADGLTTSNLGVGKVSFGGQMVLLYDSWDAYRATFYGAVAGTSASTTVVKGALLVTFDHTTDSNAVFSLYLPAVVFRADNPTPNPSGDPLKVTVNLEVMKPSSGDHVQPVLLNSVSSAY